MAVSLDDQLVIGVASSALFDLAESDDVFNAEGEEGYRRFQEDHLDDPLRPGVAFAFIKRLLSLNDLTEDIGSPLVEVIVLSRNDPDTGLRVMRSIQYHGLPITRAVFRQGRSPHKFMPAFNMSLFLSGNDKDVRQAVAAGHPAGLVLGNAVEDTDDSADLRIAFDFDGVLASDESERVMQQSGLDDFHSHEVKKVLEPLRPGPLRDLLAAVNRIQKVEEKRRLADKSYRIRVHVAIVTARNAPSHERAVRSLKSWGVTVNDAFFLGGVSKTKVLEILKPHIFFDDQTKHLAPATTVAPCVHVPFGVTNSPRLELPDDQTPDVVIEDCVVMPIRTD
ncbi:5'-nucleotidase (plasmid) [Prescottella equi]|uniref:5'-nucleotidase n=1 Tax=Rhodococcus hoagii TaxID=43767 RepID=UPI001C786D09|nr:5'-nucleotidase [Prescottella equi]BCN66527.1 5'-nucleotidase [Prescottella equi]